MIPCAFDGHAQRSAICQGEAKSFFRTAKGTLWPLCDACAAQHKKLVLDIAKSGSIKVEALAEAVFDISLEDPDALAAYQAQDPEETTDIIRTVDETWAAYSRK